MKIRIIVLAVVLGLAAAAFGAAPEDPTQSSAADRAFQEIKLLIFDERWPDALDRLDAFLERYSESAWTSQAIYYRAKSLARIGGREAEAIGAFNRYIGLRDRSRSLLEDAENSIVDLALKLYERGERGAIREAEERLESSIREVRYYAAVQLSYVKDKSVAERTVPILKEIIRREPPGELRDRARIALLRAAPRELDEADEVGTGRGVQMFRIEVSDERTGKSVFSLRLPTALADLVLGALPEEELQTLRAKGYDVQKILRDLRSARGMVISIRDPDSLKSIKIWIE